jgi:signal transduction histidine kinase
LQIVKGVPRGFSLSNLLDHFIPADMQVNAESHRRARMFMLSHVFGPILGNTLPLYLVVMNISRDYRAGVFFFSILLFWAYPFALRRGGRYQLLAFLSVQNLIFCALWACYAYGGVSSAFLYLPPQGRVRNLLLAQIFGSVFVFMGLCFGRGQLPYVNLAELQVIGMISMASVAIYFAMMSLYFAKMFHEQREFTHELNALVSTSDNLRNLTAAANQASAAKADFVAGMSHELRTPLNAIIGYSQLLLEEARDEDDEETVADLGHVHKAGSALLGLIDDILSYSRIEAGKMPINPSYDMAQSFMERWLRDLEPALAAQDFAVEIEGQRGLDHPLLTDWTAVGSTVKHLIAGIVSQDRSGKLVVALAPRGRGLTCTFTNFAPGGEARVVAISQEMFEHSDDASPSKYGSTGIEIALSYKYAQLLGGDIKPGTLADGRPVTQLFIPDRSPPQQLAA